MDKYNNTKNMILKEINGALGMVDEKQVRQLTDMICNAEKVFVVGTGRSLLMLQAFVKRLNHLGIESYYVGEINEPVITEMDILIVGSGSGENVIPVSIAKMAKKYKTKIVHIGSNPKSSISEIADFFIRIPCRTKLALQDEIHSQQPMGSLFEQCLLVLCDTVALMLIRKKNIEMKNLWRKHANLE